MGVIEVVCECGRVIRVNDAMNGKRVRCPACKGVVAVVAAPPVMAGSVAEATTAATAMETATQDQSDSDRWYYFRDGQQVGPLPFTTLQAIAATGGLSSTDQVYREGMPEWVFATSMPGLLPTQPAQPASRPASSLAQAAAASRGPSYASKRPVKQKSNGGKTAVIIGFAAVALIGLIVVLANVLGNDPVDDFLDGFERVVVTWENKARNGSLSASDLAEINVASARFLEQVEKLKMGHSWSGSQLTRYATQTQRMVKVVEQLQSNTGIGGWNSQPSRRR